MIYSEAGIFGRRYIWNTVYVDEDIFEADKIGGRYIRRQRYLEAEIFGGRYIWKKIFLRPDIFGSRHVWKLIYGKSNRGNFPVYFLSRLKVRV